MGVGDKWTLSRAFKADREAVGQIVGQTVGHLVLIYGTLWHPQKKSLRRDSIFTEVLVGASGIEPPTTTMSRLRLTLLLQCFCTCIALAVVYRCSALFIVVPDHIQNHIQKLRSFALRVTHLIELLE